MQKLLVITLALLPSIALAKHTSSFNYAYAQVERVSAVYKLVNVPQYNQPQLTCREQMVQRDSATPTVLGAIIGGAVGNAIGHNKTNKRIGTLAGVILGGAIGQDVARQQPSMVVRTQCTNRVPVVRQRQLTGYNVTYRYHGQHYTTFMHQHPGKKIKLKIQVTPAFMSSS